jgi:hypothetical protein
VTWTDGLLRGQEHTRVSFWFSQRMKRQGRTLISATE